jgi:glycosyltransferase involved in cell wall biosynthesis
MNAPRFGILLPRLERGDAIGHDALGMLSALRRAGLEARIFTPRWDRGLEAYPVDSLGGYLRSKDDVLLYHYAVGWERALEIFREFECRRVIKYHNVTPPEFFAPYNESYAELCRLGRAMLADFTLTEPDLFLCDSDYNAQDLRALAVDEARLEVQPPFHRTEELLNLAPDPDLLARFGPGPFERRTNIVFAGRVAPNKSHLKLIEAFAVYRRAVDPRARLLIAGRRDPGLAAYNRALDDRVAELEIAGAVHFLGKISEAELKAMYLVADVFALLSRHEGFCVPAIEAMALKVPLVALNRAATPETIGDAGLLFDEYEPALIAAACERLVDDGDLRFALCARGAERFEERFSSRVLETSFLEKIARFCGAPAS